MEVIENFYYELKQNNNKMTGQIAGSVVIEILLGYVPMLYPVGYVFKGDKEALFITSISIFMLIIAMYLYIGAYWGIQENGENYSIIEKLRYIPVLAADIRAYLKNKLNVFCMRVFIVCAVIQVIGNALAKTGIFYGILYACLLAGILRGIGSLNLRRIKR